jgi:hypothetical protein
MDNKVEALEGELGSERETVQPKSKYLSDYRHNTGILLTPIRQLNTKGAPLYLKVS